MLTHWSQFLALAIDAWQLAFFKGIQACQTYNLRHFYNR